MARLLLAGDGEFDTLEEEVVVEGGTPATVTVADGNEKETAVARAVIKAVDGAEEVTAATEAVVAPLTRYPTTRAPGLLLLVDDPSRVLSQAPTSSSPPRERATMGEDVYSTAPVEEAVMDVMAAVQDVHPAAEIEVERALVRAARVAVVGVVPLKAELGRLERVKEPMATAG